MAKNYEYQSNKNTVVINAEAKHFDLYLDPSISLDEDTLVWFRKHGVWSSKDHYYINYKVVRTKEAYRSLANLLRIHFTKDWMDESKTDKYYTDLAYLMRNIFPEEQ